MDRPKSELGRQSFEWLPQQMPMVAERMKEYRGRYGKAWVNTCWQRGVQQLEPGWFYAREGALSVGVPWEGLELVYADTPRASQVLVALRAPESGESESTGVRA